MTNPFPNLMPAILTDAARIIQSRGWTQGTFQNFDGFSIMGAVAAAVWGEIPDWLGELDQNELSEYDRVQMIVWNDVHDWLAYGMGMNPEQWNDDPDRTKDSVLATLSFFAAVAASGSELP